MVLTGRSAPIMLIPVRSDRFIPPCPSLSRSPTRGSYGTRAGVRLGLAVLLLGVTSLHVAAHLWPDAAPTARATHRQSMVLAVAPDKLTSNAGEPTPLVDPIDRCGLVLSTRASARTSSFRGTSSTPLGAGPLTLSLAPKTGPPISPSHFS